MDALILAAARALASGDPLAALGRVALRDDPPALALRGIALAQLGDFERARPLVRRAARAFGAKDPVARARCVVAEAEIALASRDLGWPTAALEAARATLEHHGDRRNAAYAGYLAGRRLVLMGRLELAEQVLSELDPTPFPPALRAVHELALAGIALRRVQATAARAALARAAQAAQAAGIPALQAEVRQAWQTLEAPAAHLHQAGQTRALRLDDVEALLASDTLVIDACRYAVQGADGTLALASRPILFTLAQALGQAWPDDVPRDALIAQAFRTRHPDESHRARLRVEIGRLRAALGTLAGIRATRQGFALTPAAGAVAVLTPPMQDRHAAVLALLADGEAWSSSALALATGASQRQVQRALDALAAAGRAQPLGRGRARRWITPPLPGFATTLLLPVPLPNA
ncbi:helix-turn-helix domain-containing protein [Achromobacter insuavis]|uniref:helix-turn-helix domain-containing protein n=1 Tax=Achromobacter insuavis TaxID=1287735 RepID=UPI001F135DED